MSKKKRAAIWVGALSVILGLIIYHAVSWHLNGLYTEMFSWVEGNKGYLTILYNLGLMVVSGAVIALLVDKVTVLIRR